MDHKQIGVARQISSGGDYTGVLYTYVPLITIGGIVYLVQRGNYGFAAILAAPAIITLSGMGLMVFLFTRPSHN